MKCPKTVKILGRRFVLKAVDRDVFTASGNFGNAIDESDTILYWKDANPRHKAEIIMHEVEHCINFVMDLGDNDKEEDFVTRGTTARMCVWFQDNPKLMQYIAFLMK